MDPNSICFLANGKNINPEKTIASQMSKLNKQNKKMTVLLYLLEENDKDKEQIIVKSKDIICPKCQEPCRIKLDDYKIKLIECSQNHVTESIKISEFKNTQNINISNIICDKCKTKNKGNAYTNSNNEFYICLTCHQTLCILCQSYHDKKHNIINYDNKNYVCSKHNEPLIKYCSQCLSNYCFSCDEEHQGHDTISLLDLKPNITETNNKLLALKKEIDTFNSEIKNIINKLNELIKALDMYYDINKDLLNNYEMKNRNYQILHNLKEITNNNQIFTTIKKVNNMNNLSDKLINMMELYNDIYNDNAKLNHMTIIYKINENKDNIKLFGDKFVVDNKDNCYLLIDGQKYGLTEFYELNNNQKQNKTFEIKLIETKPITNMFRFFYNCFDLIYVPDFDKWDMKNVTNLRSIFNECISLKSLPDISKWNTKNVIDMKNMFYDCYELKSIPDLSKWDVKNVTEMSQMFKNCRSLKSLPDLSKWVLNKEVKKDKMFDGCDKKIIPKKF